MNEWGKTRKPFVFLIDFAFQHPILLQGDAVEGGLLWKTPRQQNFSRSDLPAMPVVWEVKPVDFSRYREAFRYVTGQIHAGNSYLLNLTMPSEVSCNLTPGELFFQSQAPYQVYLKDHFLCFSPEIFVRIENGKILSFPMKGTIEADLPDAAEILMNDRKETAEHATIVDLIRNDLSMVADDVRVNRFRYIDRVRTNRSDLLQMSSEIAGRLPSDYRGHLGDIFSKLLPAGSICGAPKKKTLDIIRKAEQYERGYYTGVFGVFDGNSVDSCVLIRYLEPDGRKYIYKSGGGITHLSECEKEYQELIKKIYVPIA